MCTYPGLRPCCTTPCYTVRPMCPSEVERSHASRPGENAAGVVHDRTVVDVYLGAGASERLGTLLAEKGKA